MSSDGAIGFGTSASFSSDAFSSQHRQFPYTSAVTHRRISQTEFNKAVGEGQKRFAEADLSRLDLRGILLKGFSFKGSVLRGCNLEGCSLVGVELVGADLDGARLHGAQFCYNDLSGVSLRRADIRTAELINLDLGTFIVEV